MSDNRPLEMPGPANMDVEHHQVTEADDDSMPGLQSVSESSGSESDRDADEVEMQAVENDSNEAGEDDPSRRTRRRARVDDDEDQDRDRRHPSQRIHNINVNDPTANVPPRTGPPPAPTPNPNARPFRFFQHLFPQGDRVRGFPNNNNANHPPGPGEPIGGFAITIDLTAGPHGPHDPHVPPPAFIPAGDFTSFTEVMARLGVLGAALGFGGADREPEDPERAKKLIAGLEEVPLGLVRRLERVGGSGGGMGEDETRGGDSGCAICWDRLLDADGQGFGVDSEAQNGETEHSSSASTTSTVEDFSSLATEEATSTVSDSGSTTADSQKTTRPKIVSLPCAHVFHASCLIPWFSRPRQTTCPTCRFNIDPDNLTHASYRRRQQAREQQQAGGAVPAAEEALVPGDAPTAEGAPAPGPSGNTPAPPMQGEPRFNFLPMPRRVRPPLHFGPQAQGPQQGMTGAQMFLAAMQANPAGPNTNPPINNGNAPTFPPEQPASDNDTPSGVTNDTNLPNPTPQTTNPPGANNDHPNPPPFTTNHILTIGFDMFFGGPDGPGMFNTATGPNLNGGAATDANPDMMNMTAEEMLEVRDELAIDPEQDENEILMEMGEDLNMLFGGRGAGPSVNGQPTSVNVPSTTNPTPANTNHAQPNNVQPDNVPPPPQGGHGHAPPQVFGVGFGPGFAGINGAQGFGPGAQNMVPASLFSEIFRRMVAGGGAPGAGTNGATPSGTNATQGETVQPQPPAGTNATGTNPAPTRTNPPLPGANPPPSGLNPDTPTAGTTFPMNDFLMRLVGAGLAQATGGVIPGDGANPGAGPTPGDGASAQTGTPPVQAGTPGPGAAPGNMPRPSMFDISNLFPFPPPGSLREKKEWTLPSAPGPTLRQRIERREREAGLRCDEVSCGVGPSDEEPFVVVDEVSARKLGIVGRHDVQRAPVCNHTFHSSCLVSAERVAQRGQDVPIVGNDVEVSCPVCRGIGCVSKVDWDAGVLSLV